MTRGLKHFSMVVFLAAAALTLPRVGNTQTFSCTWAVYECEFQHQGQAVGSGEFCDAGTLWVNYDCMAGNDVLYSGSCDSEIPCV
jgi:hypothetical protein